MRPPGLPAILVAAALSGGGAVSRAQERPLNAPRLEPAPPLPVAADAQEQRCQRLLREFAVSSACYGRFRTSKGIKAEAFERCGPPVPDPRGADCPLKR